MKPIILVNSPNFNLPKKQYDFFRKSLEIFKNKLINDKDTYFLTREKLIDLSTPTGMFSKKTNWNSHSTNLELPEGFFFKGERYSKPLPTEWGYGSTEEGIVFGGDRIYFFGKEIISPSNFNDWIKKENESKKNSLGKLNNKLYTHKFSDYGIFGNYLYSEYKGPLGGLHGGRFHILLDSGSIGSTRWFCIMDKKINDFLIEFFSHFKSEISLFYDLKENKKNKRIKRVVQQKDKLISNLDKDGNGIIDVIEGGDDFDKLFKKNQKKIIENDKTHIQQFVKISKYLKTKRNNLQETFKLIQSSPDKESLKDLIGMLKNQIHTYELIVFNSITMLVSLIEDDLITFYEIYELFDELNIFNSNFENQVSNNLSEMNHKLGDLMYSIDSMERNIVKGFKNLSYDLDSLKVSMENNLKGIQSSLDISNFMTKFPNYPTYRIRNEYTKLQGLDI